MANKATIKTFVDLAGFVENTGELTTQQVAANIRNDARTFVRKDTYQLTNSIRLNKLTDDEYEVIAGGPSVPYAAAQEYGRPDLPNYGFTPYMRPAAKLAEASPKTRKAVVTAVAQARAGNVSLSTKVFNI